MRVTQSGVVARHWNRNICSFVGDKSVLVFSHIFFKHSRLDFSSALKMASRADARIKSYKNKALDTSEMRRRREEEGVQLRRAKREEQVANYSNFFYQSLLKSDSGNSLWNPRYGDLTVLFFSWIPKMFKRRNVEVSQNASQVSELEGLLTNNVGQVSLYFSTLYVFH